MGCQTLKQFDLLFCCILYLKFRSLACRMNFKHITIYWYDILETVSESHAPARARTHVMKCMWYSNLDPYNAYLTCACLDYHDMSIIFCLLRWAGAGKDLWIEGPKRMCVYIWEGLLDLFLLVGKGCYFVMW